MVSFRKLSAVCLFFFVFQEAKSCHKVPIKLVSVKLVYSFFFLQRFAIHAYNAYACNAILASSQTHCNNAMSVSKAIKGGLYPPFY